MPLYKKLLNESFETNRLISADPPNSEQRNYQTITTENDLILQTSNSPCKISIIVPNEPKTRPPPVVRNYRHFATAQSAIRSGREVFIILNIMVIRNYRGSGASSLDDGAFSPERKWRIGGLAILSHRRFWTSHR